MHGTNRVIEFLQKVVGIIERAVCQDIDLGRLQDTDPAQTGVQRIDEADLLPQIFHRNAASDLQALGMIGDADVLISKIPCRNRHLFNGVDPSLEVEWA